jgi:hypothetical protein
MRCRHYLNFNPLASQQCLLEMLRQNSQALQVLFMGTPAVGGGQPSRSTPRGSTPELISGDSGEMVNRLKVDVIDRHPEMVVIRAARTEVGLIEAAGRGQGFSSTGRGRLGLRLIQDAQDFVRFRSHFLAIQADGLNQLGVVPLEVGFNTIHHRRAATPPISYATCHVLPQTCFRS